MSADKWYLLAAVCFIFTIIAFLTSSDARIMSEAYAWVGTPFILSIIFWVHGSSKQKESHVNVSWKSLIIMAILFALMAYFSLIANFLNMKFGITDADHKLSILNFLLYLTSVLLFLFGIEDLVGKKNGSVRKFPSK